MSTYYISYPYYIYPYFKEGISNDIQDNYFSLILDESTDISVTKLLGVIIRYFSNMSNSFVSRYLTLIELQSGTADGILQGIENAIRDFNLDFKKLCGIGVDNASVMTGVNNGVFMKLKQKYNLSNLQLIRCICHSLQLAVCSASEETIPRNIDFLIKETYNWFSHSSLRQQIYRDIYATLNNDKVPLKIPQVSNTRWLSIEPAICRILDQWDELKAHFDIVRLKEKCYTSELLYNNYKDNTNRVYLIYLKDILNEIQKVNKAFKPSTADPCKLFRDLKNLLEIVSAKILSKHADINLLKDPIDEYIDYVNPKLGYTFEQALNDYNFDEISKQNIILRCVRFTKKLCHELKNRLPSNLILLEKMHLLHPSECLKHLSFKSSIRELAKEFCNDPSEITKIETQYDHLGKNDWKHVQTSQTFWAEVAQYRDSCGLNPYAELVNLAVFLLSLPYSNAEVERMFSQMNIVKSKLRNKLKLRTVNSILIIRNTLKVQKKCCHNFDLPAQVINQIGTMDAYSNDCNNKSKSSLSTINDETNTSKYF